MSDRETGATRAAETRGAIRAYVVSRFPAAKNLDLDKPVSLLDSGVIDSLGILDIVAFLEESFGVQVRDEDLAPENFDTLAALERFVEARRATGAR